MEEHGGRQQSVRAPWDLALDRPESTRALQESGSVEKPWSEVCVGRDKGGSVEGSYLVNRLDVVVYGQEQDVKAMWWAPGRKISFSE